MKVEMSEKELAAIMSASFCLRKSRETKSGGTYVSNIRDIENCIKIPFYEAVGVLDDFIEKASKEREKNA